MHDNVIECRSCWDLAHNEEVSSIVWQTSSIQQTVMYRNRAVLLELESTVWWVGWHHYSKGIMNNYSTQWTDKPRHTPPPLLGHRPGCLTVLLLKHGTWWLNMSDIDHSIFSTSLFVGLVFCFAFLSAHLYGTSLNRQSFLRTKGALYIINHNHIWFIILIIIHSCYKSSPFVVLHLA